MSPILIKLATLVTGGGLLVAAYLTRADPAIAGPLFVMAGHCSGLVMKEVGQLNRDSV